MGKRTTVHRWLRLLLGLATTGTLPACTGGPTDAAGSECLTTQGPRCRPDGPAMVQACLGGRWQDVAQCGVGQVCAQGQCAFAGAADAAGGGPGDAGCMCGDGACSAACAEDAQTCQADCTAKCGNGVCDKGESPTICPTDCSQQTCGNGVCEASDGGPATCPADCATSCGNGKCDGGESFGTCPADCGYCGDGVCSATLGEEKTSCPTDCANACKPVCAGKECGPDSCGGVCGSCPAVAPVCVVDHCCKPDCQNRNCGPDGCGGSCGTCADVAQCSQAGVCVCKDLSKSGAACDQVQLTEVTYALIGTSLATTGKVWLKPGETKVVHTLAALGPLQCKDTPISYSCFLDIDGKVYANHLGKCFGGTVTNGSYDADVVDGMVSGFADGSYFYCSLSGSEPGNCVDHNPCTLGNSDAKTGKCLFSPSPTGTLCGQKQYCLEGLCQCTPDPKCEDNNPCTQDCPTAGTSFVPQPPCSHFAVAEGTTCGPDAICKTGKCVKNCKKDGDCYDGNPCTPDTCFVGGYCSDGNLNNGTPCGGNKTCQNGVCTGAGSNGANHVCDAACGKQPAGKTCYCDAECKKYGDCCSASGGIGGTSCAGSTCSLCN